MRLSEAMMLGSTTCKMVPYDWNSCGLGCAANAVGIANSSQPKGTGRLVSIYKQWPWLQKSGAANQIISRFDGDVCTGRMTFEQLVDYVRSIEPSCGDCNRFDCICKPAETPEVKEALHA